MRHSKTGPVVKFASSTEPLAEESASNRPEVQEFALIHHQRLYGECLAAAMRNSFGAQISQHDSVDRWRSAQAQSKTKLIVMRLPIHVPEQELECLDDLLRAKTSGTPVVVVGDCEKPDHIFAMLSRGINGYIPASVTLTLALRAIELVLAGGYYIPNICISALTKPEMKLALFPRNANSMFTSRQATIIEALRKGASNKNIAYAFQMRESTVKVHVRNIMTKLGAKNRTEVAFLISQMDFEGVEGGRPAGDGEVLHVGSMRRAAGAGYPPV